MNRGDEQIVVTIGDDRMVAGRGAHKPTPAGRRGGSVMSTRNGSLTALEQADAFVARHIGPREDDVAAMLEAVGYESLDALMDAAVPASIRAADSGGFPRKPHRTRRAGGAGGARRAQPGRAFHDRPRLSRHAHAAGHPAQHPGESGLVHRLHALSAGDFARETGGAAQLPDHGDGPHRPSPAPMPRCWTRRRRRPRPCT